MLKESDQIPVDQDGEISLDTVGAVVLLNGRLSAGVSSGGTFLKHPGRVGQAGVYGSGCWADGTTGISTSGSDPTLPKLQVPR